MSTVPVHIVQGPDSMPVASLKAVTPLPLRQQVVEILRSAITECVFEPGGRITERELCEMLGVSRTTLREGLRQLEAEGLLEMSPNKGPVVCALDEAEAEAGYLVRGELEGLACELCASRATAEDFAELERSVKAMEEAVATSNFVSLQHAKTEFYDRIYECAGNPELTRILKRLRARVTLIRGLNINRAQRVQESAIGARQILAALQHGTPEGARRAAVQHIERAAALSIAALRSTYPRK